MVITPLRASPVASAPAGGERDVSTLEVLRVDMTRGDFFAQVRASIRSGAVLLDEVQRCARALKEADGGRPAATESAAACRVWQCLRGGAASSQAAGDHRLATPIDLSGVTDVSHLFCSWIGCSSNRPTGVAAAAGTFSADLSGWDTSSVTDMYYMFRDASVFNGDVAAIDPPETE